jgi:hypothetical protein
MSTLSPVGLITDAAIQAILAKVNAALGSDMLTFSDTNGISVALAVPGAPSVALDGVQTGAGGVSGHLHIDGISAGQPLSASLFGGFTVGLTAFDLVLAEGAFVSTQIEGQLTIPYFTNQDGTSETVDIEVAVKGDGSLSVTLAAQQSDPNSMTPDGLVSLQYDLPLDSSIDLEVATIEISENQDVWSITLTGSLALDTVSIDWPEIELRGLSIDSKGHISLQGGWLDLPSQTAIDFFGFHVALQRLGFGQDSTGRWIGFDGDLNLVEGVPIGGSVRGLQINIDTGEVSFSGVAVDFEIPGVLQFSGEIDHAHLTSASDVAAAGLPSTFPYPGDVFIGGVDVTIEAAGGLEVDAQFIVVRWPTGTPAPPAPFPGQSAFFLALDAELPAGIPLFADVALYGLSGMFASNLTPDIGSDTWWDWYKYPPAADGTPDLSGTPDYESTNPFKWLDPSIGALALGAGAVIGTQDDGFTASASIAFIVILPGPVLILIGKANILSPRISGPADEANFEAMATYDGNTGVFDLTIEAQYSIPLVFDVQATCEVYVDPPAGVWYLAIGKPPHEQRVSARVLDLFEADFYFDVGDSGLVAGFWVGYKNSWSFGPLSASVDAYLAAIAAIQKSPQQLGAGVELHGEVQLSAFGIGVGLTADALIEATAPSPWWLYGSLSVELDLPWPLPNVGGTISLTWGGQGPPPPAPLALSNVSATMIDHGASDRYELLAHRPGASVDVASPPDTVVYDAQTSGILDAQPSGYWAGLYPNADLAQDPTVVLPDLGPSTLAYAALIPQDSHFALRFAHPVADQAGFENAVEPPPDLVNVSPPPSVGTDDMSNINLQPPANQWSIQHTLIQVALYQYADTGSGDAWQLIAATPQSGSGWSAAADLPLAGSWIAPQPDTQHPNAAALLKVAPYTVLIGEDFTASWGATAGTYGTSFSDQGLQFDAGPGVSTGSIASPGAGMPPGLFFVADQATTVRITFPGSVVLTGLSGVTVQGGDIPYVAPEVSSSGKPLTPITSGQLPSGLYSLTFDSTVSEIELAVSDQPVYLMALAWSTPDIKMPILPQAPALYALKTVTQIEMGQPDSNGNVSYQPVADGNPVIEFAYLQCASGPGTATTDAPPTGSSGFPTPDPNRQPPSPALADAAHPSSSAFPEGGRLNDLGTYTQWSWPGDGDAAAYYGYDLNVEFNETYVNALYATFLTLAEPWDYQGAPVRPALHLRCVDRNQRHTLLVPFAIHVPSAYPQSANVSLAIAPPLPPVVGDGNGDTVTAAAAAAAAQVLDRRAAMRIDPIAAPALSAAIDRAGLQVAAGALASVISISPSTGAALLHELAELDAEACVRDNWFAPLQPQTRYTVDVVAGPLPLQQRDYSPSLATVAGLPGYNATDPIQACQELQEFLAKEDALTSLQRAQFATSRYATFSDQVANSLAQVAGTAATPVRSYAAPAGADAQSWLAAASAESARAGSQTAYLSARQALAAVLARFDPLFDATQQAPLSDPATGNGEQALAAQRVATEQAWEAFATTTAATFDGLIAELGHPELASSKKVPPPPDTELSLLTTDNYLRVQALLIESPEPLPWRRMWQWTLLEPTSFRARPLSGITILWSTDQTRALIVPLGRPAGTYTLTLGFEGNIGAEVACITSDGSSVSESPSCGPIALAPPIRRPPPVAA